MAEVASFSDFYQAVNGRYPFPWLARLAERVVTDGWPKHIGVPTGLGKTSCIDVAVWALASSFNASGRQLPTRTWYVVNRRLLVDAAYDHGEHLRRLLAEPSRAGRAEGVISSVSDALRQMSALGAEGGPLYVARLRGGASLGDRPPDPSQPSLIFATVPMFASSWLFRGYASSNSSRPIDAAHAGIDTLVLLDEAHLSRPLLELGLHVALCDTGDPSAVLPGRRSRPIFVAMTATGERSSGHFDLDDADFHDETVLKRLHAVKEGQLVPTTTAKLADTLAHEALPSPDADAEASVVFVNTPTLAREVIDYLQSVRQSVGRDFEVLLVTGRTRDREADYLRKRLLDEQTGLRAGKRGHQDHPLIVVATQTLEVGADVDFDCLITETAGSRSMVQRLGRLNRLGERPQAICKVCHPVDRRTWAVYGDEPERVWARLQEATASGARLDLSPANASVLLGPPSDSPQTVGELLPAHLWEWAKTTTPPRGEAPVELFFDGLEADIDVAVIWRAHRPADGARLVPSVSESEAVDVPVNELRDVLEGRQVQRLAADRASLETVSSSALRPGDTLVLAPEDGLYDIYGWNPKAKDSVLDVSPFISRSLVLDSALLDNLAPGCLPQLKEQLQRLVKPEDDEPSDGEDESSLIAQLLGSLRTCRPHPWLEPQEWEEFLSSLGDRLVRPAAETPSIDSVPIVGPRAPLKSWRGTALVRSEAFDELSFTAESHLLREHLGAVGEVAGSLAKKLGVPPELIRAVELAGRWHDLGKHDARFQRWMNPDGPAGEPMAKSGQPPERWESSRLASGWPKGGRHELLSARLASRRLERSQWDCDPDLVVHLVATHHGEGRPLVKVVDDPAPPTVSAEIEGEHIVASGDLSSPDWDQPRRFRQLCERYGLWGVALLETLVRQADWAVSQLTEVT